MADSMAALDAEVALGRALAGDERVVALVDVAREERRAERVRARDEHRRDVADVGGQARGDERADELARRDEHLAAQVAALLLGGELVLEVDAGGARLDHRPHQLEGVERPAEAGLGVGDDRRQPVAAGAVALGVLDLVGAQERLVEPAHERRGAVRRVEALVRVGLARRGSRRRRPASRRGRSPAGPPSPSAPPGRRSSRRARPRRAPCAGASTGARRPVARGCAPRRPIRGDARRRRPRTAARFRVHLSMPQSFPSR